MGELLSIQQANEQTARTIHAVEPEPAPHICTFCGRAVPPLLIPAGRYIPLRCECERAAARQASEQEQHKERMKQMAEYTYHGWLGKDWINSGMVRELGTKKFETYDTVRVQEYNELLTAQKYAANLLKKQMNKEALESLSEEKKKIDEAIAAYPKCQRSWGNALEQAMKYAENPRGVLLLYGAYGLGKTHLLAAICNKIRHRNPPVSSLFVVTPKFFSAIYDRMSHVHDEYDLIRMACATRLLVFDDLDKSGPKEFRQEIFYQIIDERVTANLPMAISTNKMESLASYIGEAAYSRLMSGCIPVELAGKDYRLNLMQK